MDSSDGSARPPSVAIANRRTRNRVAQRSFRERHARYVKELERKAAQQELSESVRLKTAEQECTRLREALTATKTRILGLSTALSGIADNIDRSLNTLSDTIEVAPSNDQGSSGDNEAPVQNEDVTHDSETIIPAEETSSHQNPLPQSTENTVPLDGYQDISTRAPQQFAAGFERVSWSHGQEESMMPDNFLLSSTEFVGNANGTHHAGHPVPNDCVIQENAQWPSTIVRTEAAQAHWLHSNPTPHAQNSTLPFNSISFPPGMPAFPSLFSAHLAAGEYFIKQNQAYRNRFQPNGIEPTCWPDMRIWWAYIQSSTVVEKLIRWKLDPCLETYKPLPNTHRPTALQLCTTHPDIIDWVFFPSIRDRMIELYSNSWMLDEVVCELVSAYVVEADLKKLVTGMDNCPPQTGYFSIWDIVQTISREGSQLAQHSSDLWGNEVQLDELFGEPTSPFETEQVTNDGTWTKMPFDQIYQSRDAALKLFKLLRMEDRRTVKVDPVFVAAHPELCDDKSVVANGIDCTLRGNKTPVPRPKPLTRETIVNYKMMLWKANM
ncbi:hypothetical protein H2204_005321 [Knufia peltigerae]|uniref:BZIP domain-containing protein n=1 Tax=Knufia peltigerae TaxID=1002370 RepID=A0AA38Y708_9EURO|nr:hypothetical protein H2204_005321 [Knufia peltigerae]